MRRVVLLSLVLGFPIEAVAQAVAATPRQGFEVSDTNGDGRVSPEEWRKRWITYLRSLDINGDRRVSRPEFGPADGATSVRFSKLDGNNDQAVRPREMTGWADWRFGVLDVNQNGMLEWEELQRENRLPGFEG